MNSLSLSPSTHLSVESIISHSLEALTSSVQQVISTAVAPRKKLNSKRENERYIQAVLNGNSQGLNVIYRKFSGMVMGYVLKSGGNEEDAQDVFQEGIMVVYRKLHQEDFSLTCAFGTYLFGVCKYLWMNQLKKKSRTETQLDESFQCIDPTDIEATLADRARHELFREKFQQLSADDQKLMSLHLEGHSMKEIANIMGYTSDLYARKKKCLVQKKLIAMIKADQRFSELV